MQNSRRAPYTCKYCGAPSWYDPYDQTPPPDYCHEADHGYPPEEDTMQHTRFQFVVFQYAGDKPLATPLLYTATPEHKEDLYDRHEALLDTGTIVSAVEEVQFDALDHDPR